MHSVDGEIVASWIPYIVCMRKLSSGEWIGVNERMFNTQILIGMNTYGYRDAF